MTLYIGAHVVKLDQDGKPLMNPAQEAYVEYEITELGNCQQTYDRDGQPSNEPDRLFAILRKVR